MDLNNYYLHAINSNSNDNFDEKTILKRLTEVLKSKKILSRRKMIDMPPNKGGWNGLDYISICDYSKKNNPPFENLDHYKGYTAYELFVKNSIAFILKKDSINGIVPNLMPPAVFDHALLAEMCVLGNHPTERYSDLPDEIQVRDEISLDHMVGMAVPIEKMMEIMNTKDIIEFLKKVKKLLIKYHRPTAFYDLKTQIPLKDEKDIEKVIKELKN